MSTPPNDGLGEILVEGPWSHRFVSAHGSRFHIAELGDGPLVLMLHGIHQFWWMWRHQIPALAEAGYRAVAVDLRGFGASDKPPRGHDTWTASADIAALVRALGEDQAVIIGHALGGWTGWATAYLHPQVCRGLVTISMPHPRVLRRALLTGASRIPTGRLVRRGAAVGMPFLSVPERQMAKSGFVARLLASGAGSASSGFPSEEEIRRYSHALALPFVADCAGEHYRWLLRSQLRSSGRRLAAATKPQLPQDVLALHGADDPWLSPTLMSRSSDYVSGLFSAHTLPGVGHFVPEEAPEFTTQVLLAWLEHERLSPERRRTPRRPR